MQFLICLRSKFIVEIVEKKTSKVANPHLRYRLYKQGATLLVAQLLHHSSGLYAFENFFYTLHSLSCLNFLYL